MTKVRGMSSRVSSNGIDPSIVSQQAENGLLEQERGNKVRDVMVVFPLLGPLMGLVCCLPFFISGFFSDPFDLISLFSMFFLFFVFSYVIGLIPALLTGCIFLVWYKKEIVLPKRLIMALVGFILGCLVTFLSVLMYEWLDPYSSLPYFGLLFITLIGAGAGALSGLWVHYFANRRLKKVVSHESNCLSINDFLRCWLCILCGGKKHFCWARINRLCCLLIVHLLIFHPKGMV